MNRVFTIVLLLSTLFCFSQNAEELNAKSKEFLQNREFDKAFPLLKEAAELGNSEAQYNLGIAYQYGMGTEKNEKAAFNWYLKSSDQGFNNGYYSMMMCYADGIGVNKNNDKAFEYTLKCANNNDSTCMWNIVNCYKSGIGTKINLEKMLEWAVKLGKLENPENLELSGNITSMRLGLAQMYRDGNDVEKSDFKSYVWFLIYNEFKRDFSVLKQDETVKEIIALENNLDKNQIELANKEAEKILNRPLANIANLHKAEF